MSHEVPYHQRVQAARAIAPKVVRHLSDMLSVEQVEAILAAKHKYDEAKNEYDTLVFQMVANEMKIEVLHRH
jgi:hypothetical protein